LVKIAENKNTTAKMTSGCNNLAKFTNNAHNGNTTVKLTCQNPMLRRAKKEVSPKGHLPSTGLTIKISQNFHIVIHCFQLLTPVSDLLWYLWCTVIYSCRKL